MGAFDIVLIVVLGALLIFLIALVCIFVYVYSLSFQETLKLLYYLEYDDDQQD